MAWIPWNDREEALKFAMVLMTGLLNLLLSSSIKHFLMFSSSILSSFSFYSCLYELILTLELV